MHAGVPPFYGETEAQIFQEVLTGACGMYGQPGCTRNLPALLSICGNNNTHVRPAFLSSSHSCSATYISTPALWLHVCVLVPGELDLRSEPWPQVSEEAKELVRRLLVRDPNRWVCVWGEV
jgi:hypothetical protein